MKEDCRLIRMVFVAIEEVGSSVFAVSFSEKMGSNPAVVVMSVRVEEVGTSVVIMSVEMEEVDT